MTRLTQCRLKELFDYDPITGVLTRRVTVNHNAKDGDTAGCPNNLGYLQVKIDGSPYYVQRLAFLYMTGSFPVEVDHENQDVSDNSWGNLREVTHGENLKNRKLGKNNTSGVIGVYRGNGAWRAEIKVGGKTICLGTYRTKLEAIDARVKANIKYGFHANHGKGGRHD
jgi:hypothetical protein